MYLLVCLFLVFQQILLYIYTKGVKDANSTYKLYLNSI